MSLYAFVFGSEKEDQDKKTRLFQDEERRNGQFQSEEKTEEENQGFLVDLRSGSSVVSPQKDSLVSLDFASS